MSESSLQTTTTPLSDPLKEETTTEEVKEAAKAQEEVGIMDDKDVSKISSSNSSSNNNNNKMSSHNHNHKNGDICWVAVLRDTVVLVETAGDGNKDSSISNDAKTEKEKSSALDVAIGELLGQPVNLGWQFYSPWQGEYKGIKFHVYDDDDNNKEDSDGNTGDDEKVIVWTFGCIYYTGVPPSSPDVVGSSSTTTTTTVVHRPRLQAFLEKIMLLTEPLRQTDVMWRHGEHYACQEIYSDMIWQRLQEEQLEYFQQAPAGAGGGMLDLDYSRTLTEVNRQVVNRHNQHMAEKDEMKRCKELALLQQMHELNQRLEQEQETSQNNNNSSSSSNSKKWWRSSSSSVSSPSSSLQNVTGGSGVAQQLLAAASRQIFSTSFSSSAESQSSSSSSINSMGGGESIATVEQQQHQQDDMAPSSSKFQQQQQQQQQGGLLHNHHYYDDDVHSVESINALSDVSSVCVEDILSQLEREVTFRDVQSHVVQHTGQQEQQQETTIMRDHHHPEEEKKEMDHDDDDEWHEPQSDSSSNKSLHNHHGEAPKSPSSTMAVVLGV